MESGLPDWFALDVWFPKLFKVWEPCGYTPELLFGITMAEGLLVFSVVMVLVTVTLTIATLLGKNTETP
jgi:disulfide bond formation protein DsbB